MDVVNYTMSMSLILYHGNCIACEWAPWHPYATDSLFSEDVCEVHIVLKTQQDIKVGGKGFRTDVTLFILFILKWLSFVYLDNIDEGAHAREI